MKIDKNYVEFIQSIKTQIVQSRYAAARLANREQLLLYFRTGKMIEYYGQSLPPFQRKVYHSFGVVVVV